MLTVFNRRLNDILIPIFVAKYRFGLFIFF